MHIEVNFPPTLYVAMIFWPKIGENSQFDELFTAPDAGLTITVDNSLMILP